jgi:hypothetical protein
MMVCCETLQISAASPVVKTVFMMAPQDRTVKLGEVVREFTN